MSIVGPFVKVLTQRESRHVGRQLGFASCIIQRVLTIRQLAKHCLGYKWDLDSSSAHEGSEVPHVHMQPKLASIGSLVGRKRRNRRLSS